MSIQERLIKGDTDALGEVYEDHFSKVYGLCLRYVKEPEVASDMVQEVFLKLYRNREKIDKELSVEQQLFQLSRNIVIDHLRRKALDAKLLAQYVPLEDSHSPEELEQREWQLKKILALVRKLPPKQRKVLELAKFRNLTYEEIAEEMGITKNTVSNHFSAAMKFLKSNLRLLLPVSSVLNWLP